MKKIEDYNLKQEQVMKRKKEKEEEMKKSLHEKIQSQKEREKKLKETKLRYESQTEGFKYQLAEKIGKINERVINILNLDSQNQK
jgi:hypothetical protein